MPSAEETEVAEETAEEAGSVDEARSALLEALTDELGDALIASHLKPGHDLWIRVAGDTWTQTGDYLRNRQRFRFFDWLSAIDWMQSPFGRSLEAAVDVVAKIVDDEGGEDDGGPTGTGADGVTGGSTRFQILARVYSLSTGLGLNLKADLPDEHGALSIGTWIETYPGVAWHEREAHEMFGITFVGNPDMRNLYLPTDFEGNPMRKDFPLLARLVKPWPGIVDVEPMPEVEAASSAASTSNPEGGVDG